MIKSLKGTEDILPPDSGLWRHLENIAHSLFAKYGFGEIRTPVIEPVPLFVRGVGRSTDIVQKQMYSFQDQGGRSICLRPEETASVVRAYIEHNIFKTQGFVKFYYIGPMFRSERPQAGRQRQFNQMGIEILGTHSHYADAEAIILLDDLLKQFSLTDYKFRINSLGCEKDKEKFKRQLKEALRHKINRFCQDCERRYNTNILRILDCKNEVCKKILTSFTIADDHLCKECKDHFTRTQDLIKEANVNFEIDSFLVRGLDYYTKTVFEVVSSGMGAQDAIAAGGRYDNLVKELGGPDTGACGFALGVERILSIVKKDKLKRCADNPKLFIVNMNEDARALSFSILHDLRKNGISCDMDYQKKSLKAQMRYADKINAEFVIVLGDDELKTREASLKNMKTGEQEKVGIRDLVSFLLNP